MHRVANFLIVNRIELQALAALIDEFGFVFHLEWHPNGMMLQIAAESDADWASQSIQFLDMATEYGLELQSVGHQA